MEVYKNMNIKSIIALLIVISIMGVTSAAVIYEYNNTATAEICIAEPDVNGIETLVSSDGVNFSENIILENVSPGDSIVLTFSHENVGDDEFLFGTVEYEISCEEGLEFNGPCEGSIHDFYDSEPGIPLPRPEPAPDCLYFECGIIHNNTWGDSYPVNGPEYINLIDDNTAELHPWDYGVFDNIEYTELTITLVDGAFGTYLVSGTVNTIPPFEIPAPIREQINETIEV